MKVIILAGGYGSRLGDITCTIPKPMVNIGNKPILWHIMNIYSYYDLNEFIVLLGYKGEVIQEYFAKNKENSKWNVQLLDTGVDTLKGGRIKKTERFVKDDIALLTYGDGVANVNIKELIKFHKSHDKILTVTGVRPPSRFGELLLEGNNVVSFEEKPQVSKGFINGGFMVFNRELFDSLEDDKNCDFEFGVLEDLAKEGQIMCYKHSGQWECVDTPRDIAYLNKLWENNGAFWKIWK